MPGRVQGKRAYVGTKRAIGAAETRQRILDAAHRLLERGDRSVLLSREVAAEAGVSRATIYKSVGSRRALLRAVFEDQGRLIDYERVRRAGQNPNSRVAVVDTVREACRAWSVMPGALRKVLALAVLDPEIGQLVAQYERYRRREIGDLAELAHGAGAFGAGVTVEEARETLIVVTAFATFDMLQWDTGPTAATERLVRLAETALRMESTSREER